MQGYYANNRQACIHRAEKWAKSNPERKREINVRSNIKLWAARSYPSFSSETHKIIWRDFLIDMSRTSTQEDRDGLCADLLDTNASRDMMIPVEIEGYLADYAERCLGH